MKLPPKAVALGAIGVLALLAVVIIAITNPALLISGYETTTVEAVDGETGESLATAEVRVANTLIKRYVGLSATETLDDDEGMLFVHDEPGEYAYVMRDMAFGIDILFIGSDGTVTAIHEAEPESPPLTEYRGTGQYVLEVPQGWSERYGVEPGDQIRFDR